MYPQYKNNIDKALDFIARGLDQTSDVHSLAIGTYVLSITNHFSKSSYIQRLDAMATNKGK